MLKKLAVLFAVLALVAAACGGDSEDAPEETTTTVAAETPDAGQGTAGGTLAAVQAADILKCGVSSGAPGFTELAPDGTFSGLDVDFCRAVAAVVLGDSTKVEFRQLDLRRALRSTRLR